MKYHVAFLAVILAALVFFSFLALSLNTNSLIYLLDGKEDFAAIISQFREKHPPLAEINFTALYSRSGQFQVLHPLLNVRKLEFQLPNRSCKTDGQLSQAPPADTPASCRAVRDPELDFDSAWSGHQEKFQVLERFINGFGSLPEDFLLNEPYVDNLGYSYALLLAMKGPKPYSEKTWVETHLSFFKVSELKEILRKFDIHNTAFEAISRLNDSEIEDVVHGATLILSKDYLLVKNQTRLAFSPVSYWVYDARELSADLKDGKFELVADSPGAFCVEREGAVCWTYNSRHALRYFHQYSLAILFFVGLLLLTATTLYLKYLYDKSREHQRRRLALQVLSHEFRTPVSSMLLLQSRLTESQTKFSQTDQDTITRLSTEIFRLQRIIEISKTYLQAESRRIPFNFVTIPSIHSWLSDFVADTGLPIELQLMDSDSELSADPFWMKFVLSSLVQNAFAHGSQPVRIRCFASSTRFRITVEDQGACEFARLDEMTDAFVKSTKSKGMGLGLNIIKFIIDEWGGELQFANSPTTFTLSLDRT